ncbi:hypothetical protein HDU97_003777 [Phlyctochytrium planicorne]|nr:hypothetical protein HDU97_003777 [Phlyctochytrium planicorne]
MHTGISDATRAGDPSGSPEKDASINPKEVKWQDRGEASESEAIPTPSNIKPPKKATSMANVELPELRKDVGRTVVIKARLPQAENESYNFDPIYASLSKSVFTGQTRKLLNPIIQLYRRAWVLLQKIIYRKMKGKFIDNRVRTARYTVFDFLPKQILVQFSKFANVYFLFISMLQIVPGWSPTGQFTTIFPLTVFVALAMLKEGFEDWQRHKQDAQENSTLARRLKLLYPEEVTNDIKDEVVNVFTGSGQQVVAIWQDVFWKDINVGDILFIEENDIIPADVLVLASSHQNGACYIETSNLDGESNLKQKQAISITQELITDIEALSTFSCNVHAESPTGNIYQFEGFMEMNRESKGKFPLTINQLLPRGTSLANTKYMYGAVLYTGEESKIRKNATRVVRRKSPSLENITNRIVIFMFFFVIFLALLTTLLNSAWETKRLTKGGRLRLWYLKGLDDDFVAAFFSNVILFNTMIPISLYVSMEFVKLIQVIFINSDLQMFDDASDTPAQARTSNLHEELGQVQYLFTDKTGTLTENVMAFKKLSVNGLSYVLGQGDGSVMPSLGGAGRSIPNLGNSPSHPIPSENLVRDILMHISYEGETSTDRDIQNAFNFLLAISLCHTVIPERSNNGRASSGRRPNTVASRNSGGIPNIQISPDDMSIIYQSSSPDEIALVDAARKMTFVMRGRTMTTVTLNTLQSSKESTYQILHTIEFSSSRKRMSIIYEFPDGRIMLLCKGADSVILERLRDPAVLSEQEIDVIERTIDHLAEFASEGLRTLLYASRELSAEEYQAWSERWEHASMALTNRAELMEEVAEEIEQDLQLLGATAIEDRLQPGVPDTIDKLRRAGMKIWMLTGDKRETAINIGYTCQLLQDHSEVIVLDSSDMTSLGNSIKNALELCLLKKYSHKGTPTVKVSEENAEQGDKAVTPHVVVVIDGDACSKLEAQHENILSSSEDTQNPKASSLELSNTSYLNQFLQLGILADCVICCRFSPSQKALVVSKVRERVSNFTWSNHLDDVMNRGSLEQIYVPWYRRAKKWLHYHLVIGKCPSGVTLAIGDGANDIPMLQCAHVGIGITGREGLAASRAADYAIAQFKFLQPLLFIHGRWSYIRISLFTLGTFYKCLSFYLTQLLFQIFTGWSGTSLYESWTLTLYNILFSSLPVIATGIFEKDLNRSTLLYVPELYRFGQLNRGLNATIFLKWTIQGMWHAVVAVFIPVLIHNGFGFRSISIWGPWNQSTSSSEAERFFCSDISGAWQESSIYALGTMSYTVIVMIVNVKVCYMDSHNWTLFTHLAFVISIAVWWVFTYIYAIIWPKLGIFGFDTAGMWDGLNRSQTRYWAVQLFCIVLAVGLFDVVMHPGLWRFGSAVITKKDKSFILKQQAEDAKKKGGSVSKKPSKSPKRSFTASIDTSQLSSKSSQSQKKPSVPKCVASGLAAADFAKSLQHIVRGSAENGVSPDDVIDWSEIVPLWQLWEKENRIPPDQEMLKDFLVGDRQRSNTILKSKSVCQDRDEAIKRDGSLLRSSSLKRPGSIQRPSGFGPKPSRGDSLVRNSSSKRSPYVLGSSVYLDTDPNASTEHHRIYLQQDLRNLEENSSHHMVRNSSSKASARIIASSIGSDRDEDSGLHRTGSALARNASRRSQGGGKDAIDANGFIHDPLSRQSSLRREHPHQTRAPFALVEIEEMVASQALDVLKSPVAEE